jgi:hypothetical protein
LDERIKKKDGRGMLHVWGTGKMHIEFWCGSLRKRDHFEGPGVDVKVKIKIDLKEIV